MIHGTRSRTATLAAFLSSLGYEHHDGRLCRLGLSLAGVVTSADRTDPVSLLRLRLPRLMLFRRVRFTNPFTYGGVPLNRGSRKPAEAGVSGVIDHRAGAGVNRRAILRAGSGISGVRGTITREPNGR